ncbi:hypothetical protein [Actinomycetospora chibensis]|uniref:Superfamily III holin-X n=1 Tax=Actinomycetospora chibensis TaxID=663606 RepID=A0ABV9REZ6_9PSEU|nr:hypothetical protein [Actinomycetospora chibensis]MDD7925593.1 hypothetical protein [Actinomycetospora chibensis]
MTAAAAVDDRPAPQAPALAEAPQPTGEMPSAGDRLKQLAIAALDKLAGAAVVKVEELSDKLGDMAADAVSGNMPTGVGANALMKGVLAKMEGKNPVIAALKGAFGAMSTSTKIWLSLALILLAVLSPVALLVLALVLLVAAIVGAVKG